MFTGIIVSLGKILKIEPRSSSYGKGLFLSIQSDFKSLSIRESIAVNGVCLTVIKKQSKNSGTLFGVEVGEETLKKTSLGKIRVGDEVNLERSLKANSRISGHFVQGHVDGTGQVLKIGSQGNSKLFTFSYPPVLQPFMITKGSISVDGISLTIVNIYKDSFTVSILPFTEEVTSLRTKKIGDLVNLEADILVKIMAKQFHEFAKNNKILSKFYKKKDWNPLLEEVSV